MSKKSKLVQTLREIIKREVQKEVKKIFISEGLIRPTQSSKPKEEVSYVKDPMLNKVLNETANKEEFQEYPTMGGGTFDSTKMAQAIGYGNVLGDAESRRKIIETETSMQSLFDHTADTKAQNRLLLWYTLMLTNIQREKDEQPENYFKGKNFEDKLEDYYSKEDEASALYSEIIKKVTTVLAFWFFNQASSPEEFNKLIEDVEKGEV
jgi:hypothetical protein